LSVTIFLGSPPQLLISIHQQIIDQQQLTCQYLAEGIGSTPAVA
jgi:hypothetical protein